MAQNILLGASSSSFSLIGYAKSALFRVHPPKTSTMMQVVGGMQEPKSTSTAESHPVRSDITKTQAKGYVAQMSPQKRHASHLHLQPMRMGFRPPVCSYEYVGMQEWADIRSPWPLQCTSHSYERTRQQCQSYSLKTLRNLHCLRRLRITTLIINFSIISVITGRRRYRYGKAFKDRGCWTPCLGFALTCIADARRSP